MADIKSRGSDSHTKESKSRSLTYSFNFRCRKCFMIDGYSEGEKKCRWCGQELLEMDRL
jgi:uncharacterized protein (DUF983 family)